MKEFALPKRWTVTQQVNAHVNHQARLRLDHTVRSLATRLGADADTAAALVLQAHSVFVIVNAVPRALDPDGQPILADTGLPLTVEDWTRLRLTT